jgi:glycine C-acetyltransferase
MGTSIKNIRPEKTTRGEFGLKNFLNKRKPQSLLSWVKDFSLFIQDLKSNKEHSYFRLITSAPGRKVIVMDEDSNEEHKMLLFASNNYLGLGNNSHIKKKVKEAIDTYGTGLGGPPILNGYTQLMKELEQRVAQLKRQEDCMIFSSGYNANLGFVTALVKCNDLVIYDELSHASLYDALKLNNATGISFKHNDVDDLERKLAEYSTTIKGTIFVCFEGIYSMDGDISPLSQIIPIIKKFGAISVLDDAHGLGVLGIDGSGTAEHFKVSKEIDISMGTFSKSLAGTGGFLAGRKEIINYMRYFARPYMFSASLPPMTLAAILAGLDVIKTKPQLRGQLCENIKYAQEILSPYNIVSKDITPIIALLVPEWMDIRKANSIIHEYGIFLNAIEYPAVPKHKQRFRISLMAQHTKADINKLAKVLADVWADQRVKVEFHNNSAEL